MTDSIEHRLRSSDREEPAALGVDRLHAMCEQLCRLPGNDPGEIAAALGLPGPIVEDSPGISALALPPAFARRILLAGQKDSFSFLDIELAGTGLSVAELDRRFGPGVQPPMGHDDSPYMLRYQVVVAGAPWSCVLLASFNDVEAPPHAGSVSTELVLHRDRVDEIEEEVQAAPPVGDPLRAVAALLARFDQTLAGADDDRARREAADQVGQLRAIAAAALQRRVIAGLDHARLDQSLAVFAAWLRAPDTTAEADARRAMADLASAFGPLLDPRSDPAAAAAERAHHQQQAGAAIEAYLAAHPIAPMQLPRVPHAPSRELPDLGSLDLDDDPDDA